MKRKRNKRITILLILITMELQSCVTYDVKRLGGIKENERELEKMIDRQIEENYKLNSNTYKKEEN